MHIRIIQCPNCLSAPEPKPNIIIGIVLVVAVLVVAVLVVAVVVLAISGGVVTTLAGLFHLMM